MKKQILIVDAFAKADGIMSRSRSSGSIYVKIAYMGNQIALSTANSAKISAKTGFLIAKSTLEELLTKKIE